MNRLRRRCSAYLPFRALLALPILALLAAVPLAAQTGRAIPGAGYFAALDDLYAADYTRAERGFVSELRGGIKTTEARWIDSICYFTMLGETYFVQGAHAAALDQFDQAIDLFMANRAWLTTVQLNQPVREDLNLPRRMPAWARPLRAARYCDVPATFLATIGRIDNSQQAQQGGIIQAAQFWQLDAQELARCVAWSIYRRGELLGPLAPYDARQKAVSDLVARGGLAPATAWSNAWVNLWQGVAALSLESPKTALPHLQQATQMGPFDHPLTGIALLAQGRLALEAQQAVAPQLLHDAAMAGVAYEDYLVVAEAVRYAHQLQLSIDPRPLPWLEPMAAWCTQRGLDETAIRCRLALSECALEARRPADAAALLRGVMGRNRFVGRGPLGREAERLSLIVAAQQGAGAKAELQAAQLITKQRSYSLRGYRRGIADAAIESGLLSPRNAERVYERLLADPSAADWRDDPLDTLADLADESTNSFDRWFAAATVRRSAETMLAVAEQQSRRRFLAGQPLGGRVLSLRLLLETSAEALGDKAVDAKGAILDRRRDFVEFSARAEPLLAKLKLAAGSARDQRDWEATLDAREAILTQIALSRLPTPLVAAPSAGKEITKQLTPGSAILLLRVGAGEVFGMAVSPTGVEAWRIGDERETNRQLVAVLKLIAGVGRQQRWTVAALVDTAWRDASAELAGLLLSGAPAEIRSADHLTIIPDASLWHTPWPALMVGDETKGLAPLIEQRSFALAPTLGHALKPSGERRRLETTGVIGFLPGADAPQDPIAQRAPGAVVIEAKPAASPAALKTLLDAAIISIDQDLEIEAPLALRLLPAGRGRFATLEGWTRLPTVAPTMVVLTGLHSAAEDLQAALRSRKRGTRRIGDEVFHAVCSLLAPGTSTVLMSQWSSGGLHERELIAEFMVGVRSLPPGEAWRRSVELNRTRLLNLGAEPRVSAEEAEAGVDGSHPLFWCGFLLVD
ncbi:CHAT domain-containing protein [Botrimarina hoheduenensis]|uniref:CHAT domain protein n=1 Tax=Botrimarina hoheduenensis TaxID=2528000 RepID=A0A5C5VYD2_9BACT|nr:CHAT domain-containing protein [Botrimarina hoheduenensis]TWT42739.1 CHAT domain protein [Botrimarina hoheduenensis]